MPAFFYCEEIYMANNTIDTLIYKVLKLMKCMNVDLMRFTILIIYKVLKRTC